MGLFWIKVIKVQSCPGFVFLSCLPLFITDLQKDKSWETFITLPKKVLCTLFKNLLYNSVWLLVKYL